MKTTIKELADIGRMAALKAFLSEQRDDLSVAIHPESFAYDMDLAAREAFAAAVAEKVREEQMLPNSPTLRNLYAAHALTGLLAQDTEDHGHFYDIYIDGNTGNETSVRNHFKPNHPGSFPNTLLRTAAQNIALKSFEIADAMIEASQAKTNAK